MDAQKLNPSIHVTYYGKRELKPITIYPLSVGDQLKITDIIAGVIGDIADKQVVGGMNNYAYVNLILATIKDNINKLIPMVSDLKEEEVPEFLDNLTNDQLMEIVDIIWTNSYEPSVKKGQDLFARMRKLFPSKRSLQASSNGIQDTDSPTSLKPAGETED